MNTDLKQTEQTKQSTYSSLYYFGAFLLLCALVASLVLAGTKLGFVENLPGCGLGSGCDAVTNGPWGRIPVLLWPVSFVGVSWFFSLFIVWLRGGFRQRVLLWIIRIGVLGSVGFLIIMFGIGHFCKWCALAHVCNILFWIVAEIEIRSHQSSRSSSSPLFPLLFVFVSTSIVLGLVWLLASMSQQKQEEVASEENVQEIVTGISDEATLQLLDATHRIGPENAAVQVVIFTDYQCPDCKRIEGQLEKIVATRDDVSVSVKHFPLNFECNDNIGTFKLHSNACWAARAAEAAAIVGGDEGWERMHTWLFAESGRFTDQTFEQSLFSLGFDPSEFIAVMMSNETVEVVKANADDGAALGIYFTPMVFINGVEYLWYYGGADTLENVIDLVAKNVEGGGGAIKPPPNAADKLVEDWRVGRVFNLPGHEDLSWLGDGDIEFVVWGDYQAELSAQLDQEIKNLLAEDGSNIRYAFRNFPVDELCNGGVSRMPTKYDGSCYLSKLVEAVDILAGDDQQWAMHDWILSQSFPVDLDKAGATAVLLGGTDESTLQAVVDGIEVGNRMREDIMTKNTVWRKAIPVLTVDGRFVPRWRSKTVPASDVFHQILEVMKSEN
ncbi:thioredoxin domain-containing protein [bacterium]|nr:thioredoxin domain-containing protein [bacterium]